MPNVLICNFVLSNRFGKISRDQIFPQGDGKLMMHSSTLSRKNKDLTNLCECNMSISRRLIVLLRCPSVTYAHKEEKKRAGAWYTN